MRHPDRDPGLQPERTRLAWRRTALAFTVVAVLAARLALPRGVPGLLAALVAAAGWAATIAALRPRPAAAGHRQRPTATPLAALAAAGYAVLGAVVVLGLPSPD
nr:DUF202 domain-containing protein [Micromonospora sp. DSM 115978]